VQIPLYCVPFRRMEGFTSLKGRRGNVYWIRLYLAQECLGVGGGACGMHPCSGKHQHLGSNHLGLKVCIQGFLTILYSDLDASPGVILLTAAMTTTYISELSFLLLLGLAAACKVKKVLATLK
jgi:hypothetical protein